MIAGKGFWDLNPFLKKGLTPEARMLDHYTTGLDSILDRSCLLATSSQHQATLSAFSPL